MSHSKGPAEGKTYYHFIKTCQRLSSEYEEKNLSGLSQSLASSAQKAHEEVAFFKKKASEFLLMTAVYLWAREISHDRVKGEAYLQMMEELIENHLLPHIDPKSKRPLQIQEFAKLAPSVVIDKIRCFDSWSLDKQEDHVKFYLLVFSPWLSGETFDLVPKAIDPDRQVTDRRKLPFDTYIDLLKDLDLRERILAKIFYLGGSRELEEVLSLEIKDIGFSKHTLRFPEGVIHFPPHLFLDLKAYISSRKTGHIFISREGTRMNHSVPYRALRTVSIRKNLGEDFTFKNFVLNI